MKPIFQYEDHRVFLKDYYEEQKSLANGFSYGTFSKLAGIKSANFLKYIIDGEKKLSLPALHKVARTLELNRVEHQFFEAMVLHVQSQESEEKNYYQARLKELARRKNSVEKTTSKKNVFERWYYPIVLVALDGWSSKEGYKKLARITGLSESQLKETIGSLLDKDVVREKDGRFEVIYENMVVSDKKSTSQTVKKFLQDQIELSAEQLEKNYGKRAKFFSQTVTISKDNFEELVRRLQAFRDEFSTVTNEDTVEEICQLNMQFFSVSG